jgi:two-component system, response regulator PdtaR
MTSSETGGVPVAGGHDAGELTPILLVEDEIFIRIASADWLREAGYQVIEAADPLEALDILASGQPLVLLATDITMPGPLDGLGLAARVRAQRPDLPIVLLSAHVPVDVSSHADAALPKPFGPSELVSCVIELIGEPWQTKTGTNGASNAC